MFAIDFHQVLQRIDYIRRNLLLRDHRILRLVVSKKVCIDSEIGRRCQKGDVLIRALGKNLIVVNEIREDDAEITRLHLEQVGSGSGYNRTVRHKNDFD